MVLHKINPSVILGEVAVREADGTGPEKLALSEVEGTPCHLILAQTCQGVLTASTAQSELPCRSILVKSRKGSFNFVDLLRFAKQPTPFRMTDVYGQVTSTSCIVVARFH